MLFFYMPTESNNAKQKLYKLKRGEYTGHSIIINLIGEKPKRILDVGCSTGYVGEILKKKGHYVVGIDVSKIAIKEAGKKIDEAYCADIENTDFSFLNDKFDVILLGDILEHLVEPLDVLKKLSKYLENTGALIISVPNIANWKIRVNLLLGRFNYSETGLLDSGHLRFFTKKTIIKLLDKAGFYPTKIKATHPIARIWPTLLSPGFVIEAVKKER